MQPLTIHLQTLTPIWTGGVNPREMDRLQETSIIGSLRWWYEILMRSLGQNVCDITSDNSDKRCNYENNKQVCDVCKIFGCTGWSRKFTLRMGNKYLKSIPGIFIPSGRCHFGKRGKSDRPGGWHLPNGYFGNMSLHFIPAHANSFNIFNALLLMERHANFTPKSNVGYGVFKIANREQVKEKLPPLKIQCNPQQNSYPLIQNMFFINIRLPKPNVFSLDEIKLLQSGKPIVQGKCVTKIETRDRTNFNDFMKQKGDVLLPISPIIKNRLRYKYKHRMFDIDELLGKAARNDSIASKINISNLYLENSHWEFRVWGWLEGKDEKILDELHNFFNTEISRIFNVETDVMNIEWREFDSHRDSVSPNEKDIERYIRSLLHA